MEGKLTSRDGMRFFASSALSGSRFTMQAASKLDRPPTSKILHTIIAGCHCSGDCVACLHSARQQELIGISRMPDRPRYCGTQLVRPMASC